MKIIERAALLAVACLTLSIPHRLCAQGENRDIRWLVRHSGVHGGNYETIVSCGRKAIPTLLEMIKDPKEQKSWSTVVVYLGILGDDREADILINFFDRDFHGEVNADVFSALRMTHIGLGYIAGKGSDKALDYLLANAKDENWKSKKLPWHYEGISNEEVWRRGMVGASIMGLSISGRTEAIRALKRMEKDQSSISAELGLTIGIKRAEMIRKHGPMKCFTGVDDDLGHYDWLHPWRNGYMSVAILVLYFSPFIVIVAVIFWRQRKRRKAAAAKPMIQH